MNIQRLKVLAILIVMSQLTACSAWLTHYNNKETIDSNEVVFIDAKQRAIYSAKNRRTETTVDGITVNTEFYAYCAEPSPDGLSALAATMGVDLSVAGKGELAVSSAIAESASNIGVRTAAIQALRDFMYRNCEAYAMGGISDFGIETLQRRFQSTMVGILAIEQLTGAVKSAPVTIVSNTSAGSPDAILDLTAKSSVALSALNTAKDTETQADDGEKKASETVKTAEKAVSDHTSAIKSLEERKATGDTLSPEDEKKLTAKDTTDKELNTAVTKSKESEAAAKKVKEDASLAVKKTQEAYDGIESSRRAALTGGGNAQTSATYAQVVQSQKISDTSAKHISIAVENIVRMTTEVDYWTEVCTTVVGQHKNDQPVPGSSLEYCNFLLLAAGDEVKEKEIFDNILDIRIAFGNETFGEDNAEDKIKKLQKKLNENNYTVINNTPISQDGIWGPETKNALMRMLSECANELGNYVDIQVDKQYIDELITAVEKARKKHCVFPSD